MLMNRLLRSILIDADVDVIFGVERSVTTQTSCVGDNAIFPPQGKIA